ncbi:hypothetical protein BWZ20_09815 [Winogradskyella sp. J14-2]|nr:FeoB-associated Cys-rich membrane protein [Winogradskyella sp. J14-2]APY08579.1 hypothetical protein BWZ20_09815 [Winogradskyella sp. J14-2]
MNDIIQNILVFSALLVSIGFLIRKFIWKPKRTSNKSCGSDGCGCN